VCIVAKFEHGAPILLTEHGIYYRERMIDLISTEHKLLNVTIVLNFFKTIASLNYFFADKITPVAKFNTKWERNIMPDIDTKKIEVIYNGIDLTKFRPLGRKSSFPTVVMVARIDPLKDILNLIECAKFVVEQIPNVKFKVYGEPYLESYYRECLERQKELGLENTIIFEGHTDTPELAYNEGDVVVVSSISEGFPYAVIEAMACGRQVVATDVGGTSEAMNGIGVVVSPRSPIELADKIVCLLKDPKRREKISVYGRALVTKKFDIRYFFENHRRAYLELISKTLDRESQN
jgi:glycosyltransferase involved in cell wall biosynthesis